MNCLCSVVVDGALFFDDYFYRRPVEEDLEIDALSSYCPRHAAGREFEKCRQFSEVLMNSYWYAKAHHPLRFVVEPRVSLDVTVNKYVLRTRRESRSKGDSRSPDFLGALKCSSSWRLSEPLIFVRIFIIQV